MSALGIVGCVLAGLVGIVLLVGGYMFLQMWLDIRAGAGQPSHPEFPETYS